MNELFQNSQKSSVTFMNSLAMTLCGVLWLTNINWWKCKKKREIRHKYYKHTEPLSETLNTVAIAHYAIWHHRLLMWVKECAISLVVCFNKRYPPNIESAVRRDGALHATFEAGRKTSVREGCEGVHIHMRAPHLRTEWQLCVRRYGKPNTIAIK